MTEHRLIFSNDIHPDSATVFRNQICNILAQRNLTKLIIQFSSNGGSTEQSIALYDFIQSVEFPIQIHAVSHVGSAAVPVFLAANRRTAEPTARFFFHEYCWTFNGSQPLHNIVEAVKRLRADINNAREIVTNRANIPEKVLKALDGRGPPVLIDATEAKAHNLIEKITSLEKASREVVIWSA